MKTKFNEKDVPSWCKWIAVDKSGSCWAYSVKPEVNVGFYGNRWWPKQNGKWIAMYSGKPPENWKDELYTWGC